mgnify:CR=1 FL=1
MTICLWLCLRVKVPSLIRLLLNVCRHKSASTLPINSLLIVYPDQLGDDPQEIVSFSDPRGQSETRVYDNVGKWFYKWFKKGDERN